MTENVQPHPSGTHRVRTIAVCGILILLLSAGSALLPIQDRQAGARVVGILLSGAGVLELIAGSQRREVKGLAMAAGGITLLAGLSFLLNPSGQFMPAAYLVMAWLFVRSLILLVTVGGSHGSVRMWTAFSAAMDFLLGMFLLLGVSISALILSLFGPTAPLVATFAWVLALSFVITGSLQLEIASCERAAAE